MRLHWGVIIVAVCTGCSEDPAAELRTSDPSDARITDADTSPRPDVRRPDGAGMDARADAAGPRDLGGRPDFQTGPDAGGSQTCAFSQLGLNVAEVDSTGRRRPAESQVVQGTIIEAEPNWIRLAVPSRPDHHGRYIDISAGAGPRLDGLRLGERVELSIEAELAFWGPELRVVLRTRDSVRARFAAWEGSRYDRGVLGSTPALLSYGYQDGSCTRDDPCGTELGLDLVVLDEDVFLTVAPGDTTPGPLKIFNGASSRFIDAPTCTDIPSRWHAGVVLVEQPVDDCDRLSRDACIASPDCALHGSEDFDPGYVCHPAVLTCERFDAVGCAAVGCDFDIGECYCPEGAVCVCGGGPPPLCRERCDPATDFILCGDRGDFFCEVPAGNDPASCLSFEPGACHRIPTACDGVLHRDTCGCPEASTSSTPARFDNDCERRQASASLRASGCEP